MNRAITILIILFSLLMFTNFKNQSNCQLKGEIIGADATRCGCCGGWKIAIGESVFLTDSIPNGILDKGPDGCHIFPQKIYLDYEMENYCSRRIKLTCVKKRD